MLSERVLYLLEQNRGKLVTGGELAKQLDVSRTAIWKAVRALREDGSEIEALPNSGYRLLPESDGLSGQSIHDMLATENFGRSMELLESVASTNQYLKGLDTASLGEGYTVVADGQTSGRGRLGRPFYSPAREGVYLSVLLKPAIPLAETAFLTICAAVAVCRAVEAVCGVKTGIKWVNDIYVAGKKLCGILTEAFISAEMQSVDYAVAGIGINTGDIPAEVEDTATSIYAAAGVRGIRNRLIAQLLNQFEGVYTDYTVRGKKREILEEYAGRLFIIGREVEVSAPGGVCTATVLGVNDSGGLMVKRRDGEIIHLGAGEIKITDWER
ncbi:bifunctional ligase/repressor BirA [Clostridia bacterium]|nr:bifunctional ligase/repressor BirA [Clostridia bacterium]